MRQHDLHQVRSEEPSGTCVTSMTPGKKTVTWHRQAVLLLPQICLGVIETLGSRITKRVVLICFIVYVWVSLNVVIRGCNSHAVRDVDAVKVEAVWGCDLW